MKRIAAAIILLLAIPSACLAAFGIFQTYLPQPAANPNLRQQNFFGLTGSDWSNFTGNYTPGLGNPAVATDDYYHQNGLAGFRPFDLTAADCGATGASIAASRGRYAWAFSADHGQGGDAVWNGSFSFRIGYSNDPGVPPDRANFIYDIGNVAATPTVATITASISNGSGGAGNILAVSAVTGFITNGGAANVSGSGVTTAQITSQSTGTAGSTGNYVIGGAAQFVASQTMTVTQASYFLYYGAQLVCNPDDSTYPFYLYAEGQANSVQHQQGVMKSADLLTWTTPQPTHISLNFNSWSSFQKVRRIGTGNWTSLGYQIGYPQNGNTNARSEWTSTDGLIWAPAPNSSTNMNWCIPASNQSGTSTTCTGNGIKVEQSPDTDQSATISGSPWTLGHLNTLVGGTRIGSQWAGRAPLDADFNVIDSPAQVNVSSAYGGEYPGPSYLQVVNGYVEDGIAHYYAAVGWPISSGLWVQAPFATYSNNGGCAANPVVNGQQGFFQFTGFTSGTTLTVQSLGTGTIQLGSLIYGNGISTTTNNRIVSQISGTPNGVGDYTISSSITVGSGTISGSSCGGLWQQAIDYYTEVVDATAAASAAPVGVRATCAAGTASLTWYNSLPHQNYRVYRGTSAGSQPTLVGDVTGTSTTNVPGSDGVFYYKVVTINGTEQGSRIVSTYCSSSSAFVNAHMARALAAGADASTCDKAWMDTFDAWLVSNSLSNNLLFATMVDFCVAKDGSNVISKIFDMGTTRLPRGGDYTPTTSNTTYNATGINGNPAWVNGTNTAYGYYGGDRAYLNNIRRQTQITFFAAYQKPGTAAANAFVLGQFTNRTQLSHTSGSPGSISCLIYDGTQQKDATATVSGSATDFHTMACTYDGDEWRAWSDATMGSLCSGCDSLAIPSPNLSPADNLTGQIGSANLTSLLISGSETGYYNRSAGAVNATGNTAQFSGGAQIVFDKALTSGQMTSLNTLIRTHYGF